MGKKWKKLLRIRRNEAKQQEAVAVAAPAEPAKVAKKVQPIILGGALQERT